MMLRLKRERLNPLLLNNSRKKETEKVRAKATALSLKNTMKEKARTTALSLKEPRAVSQSSSIPSS
jgi:hypothetical protein